MPDYRHILLIKPSSMGDIVHAMPTCAAIRRAYPKARLTWLVKREWAGLVERIEGVDRVWPVEATLTGWLSQVPSLRAEHFDLVVDLQGLLRSAAIGWLSGSPLFVGFATGREGSPWFYSKSVPVPSLEMHAVDRYLLVAKAVGASEPGIPEFHFRIPQSDHEEVDRLLLRSGVVPGTSWVVMNVSARWPTKRWPVESFAEVADRLQQEGYGSVVLIGGPDERAEVTAVRGKMKTPAIDLTGATTVGLLPALLSKAALLITNDSGPMHIAAAVGSGVVGLFGPTSAVLTGPYGAGHHVLTGNVPCRPCFSRTCHNAVPLECLRTVSPNQVLEAVRAIWPLRVVPQ
ncbi:MAG: glycosyltransferase family 9 protein [Nitrospira sp.]|nr:glycosyltransferase family 9 protein [Nitrospira sp.]MBP0121157.1 glycosyltransferase family 9 protein [Nitrospira sp.]MBP0129813.1 glycosyltransferase family 9 protein [Nitrospira sp.]